MVRHVILLAALAGCDTVFDLANHDAGSDTSSSDGPPPAHDEDADSLPDTADPCPADSGDAADADHDDVGDVCDPGPAIDHRVLFDPFTADTGSWMGSGAWTYRADSIATNASARVSQQRDVGSVTHATVEVAYGFAAQLYSFSGVGLVIGAREYKCFLFVSGTGDPAVFFYNGETYEAQVPWSGQAPVHIYLTHLPDDTFRCRVRSDGQATVELVYRTAVAGPTTAVALYAESSSIDVTSVQVIQTP